MSYIPTAPPAGTAEQKAVTDWIEQELKAIAAALTEIDGLRIPILSVSPGRPRSGMIAYADSVNWNPGSGAGFYGFVYSGSVSSWQRF